MHAVVVRVEELNERVRRIVRMLLLVRMVQAAGAHHAHVHGRAHVRLRTRHLLLHRVNRMVRMVVRYVIRLTVNVVAVHLSIEPNKRLITSAEKRVQF